MNRRTLRNLLIASIGIPVLIVAGFSVFVLDHANKLPWQSDPTRIPVTPFANIANVNVPPATVTAAAAGTQQPVAAVGNDSGAYVYPAATTSAQSSAAQTTTDPSATAGTSAANYYGSGGSYGTYGASSASASENSGATGSVATAADPVGAAPTTTTAGGMPASTPSSGNGFVIVADQSEAKITVDQKLAALPAPNSAVLTTRAFQGQIILGPDGKPSTDSLIRVDLRTLKSDEPERDNYIRGNTLQSDKFPLAEYKLTGVSDWTGPLQDGQTTKFKLTGQMTIHGTTKPVTFETTATRHGNTITGTADTKFKFQDFGMSAPNIAGFVKATDTIKLHVSLTAAQQ